MKALYDNAERLEQVEAIIKRNEVAINMTPEEVLRSLGKLRKKTTRINAQGQEEVWEYIRYERIPQQVTGYDPFGRLVASTIYVKEPVGQLSVFFKNDLVSELEQSEGMLTGARTKILAARITLF